MEPIAVVQQTRIYTHMVEMKCMSNIYVGHLNWLVIMHHNVSVFVGRRVECIQTWEYVFFFANCIRALVERVAFAVVVNNPEWVFFMEIGDVVCGMNYGKQI